MKTPLWQLYLTFAKIGALTFGGGMAMFPILEREVADNKHWATIEELLDFYAIGQCTPGIIAVNTSTFIGYRQRGPSGAAVSSLGMVTPSFIIILLLASVLKIFQGNVYLLKAFSGIRIAVCALILKSVLSLGKKAVIDIASALAITAAVVANLVFKLSTVYIVISALFVGIAYHYAKSWIKAKGKSK